MTDPTATIRAQHCWVLGLSADQKLITDDVISAWRQANLRWHPKRPGGDLVQHQAAQAAHAYLRDHLEPPTPSPSPPSLTPPTPINSSPPLLHQPKSPPAPTFPLLNIKPPYSIRHHNGTNKLCLELRIPLRRLVEGDCIQFKHINGREYGLTIPPGTWGGTAELPGLGYTPSDPLLILLCPLYPSGIPPKAHQLITEGLALCDETETHSLMLHELIPALTK